MYNKRKAVVKAVGLKQLKENRIEHNKAVLEKFGEGNVIVHVDSKGNKHRIIAAGQYQEMVEARQEHTIIASQGTSIVLSCSVS